MSVPNDFPWLGSRYGWVFMGLTEASSNDLQRLYDQEGTEVEIDTFSICGRWNKWWTGKQWLANDTTMEKPGGIGSHTYEVQKVGAGVEFKPEDQPGVWHVNPEGQYVMAPIDYPRTGRSFYKDYAGTTRCGPNPDSPAAEILGEGSYWWDEEERYWVVIE